MNIDIVLFAGRIVLVVLLYIFLFAVMKTGVGLVRGQRRDSAIWTIDVDKGPRGIRGIHVDMLGPSSSAVRRRRTSASTNRLSRPRMRVFRCTGTYYRRPQLA